MNEQNINVQNEVETASEVKQKTSWLFNLTKRDIVFGFIIGLVTILFSTLALCGDFRVGYTVTSTLFTLFFSIYLWNKSSRIRLFPLICGILGLVLPAVFTITSNEGVRFWSFVATTLLSAVWLGSLVSSKKREGDLELAQNIGEQIIAMFAKLPKSVASFFGSKGARQSGIGKMFLGIACSVPVLFIVVPLLIKSDAAFAGLTERFFENAFKTFWEVVLGLIIAPFMVSYAFSLKFKKEKEGEKRSFKGIDKTIVISFLSMLSICYLTYLFSQLAYFFSAFRGFLPEEFKVADYARRGFFEMTAIAAINFVLIFAAILLTRKKEDKTPLAVRLLCLFVSIFTLIIIATALSKMALYIESFGMTLLRITTSAFMVFLGVVFISIILRLFIKRVKVLRAALLSAACILLILGSLNVNLIVADYNYNAFVDGKLEEIDMETLSELGDEGVPYLIKLSDHQNVELALAAEKHITELIEYDYYEIDYQIEDSDFSINDSTWLQNYTDESSEVTKQIVGRRYLDLKDYSISRAKAYEALDEFIDKRGELYGFQWK